MIEFLRHFFGFCGEGHPSVLSLLFGAAAIKPAYQYMRARYFLRKK